MAFPRGFLDLNTASSIQIKVAKDVDGNAIGVEMLMLIPVERVRSLPGPYKAMAQGVLYSEVTKDPK